MEMKKFGRNICVAMRQKAARSIRTQSWRRSLDTDAVPLWVGLVVFVSLMFDHSVAADAYVWPGHLHSIQSDPATHKDTISIRERKGNKGRDGKEKRLNKRINRKEDRERECTLRFYEEIKLDWI